MSPTDEELVHWREYGTDLLDHDALDAVLGELIEARATISRIKAADPELFDTDEDAEEWVYETYGSAGRRLRRDFLEAVKGR